MSTVNPHDPEYRQRAILFNDITHAPIPRDRLLFSERQALADFLHEQGWRRPERPEDVTDRKPGPLYVRRSRRRRRDGW